jgi:hypothetical protein
MDKVNATAEREWEHHAAHGWAMLMKNYLNVEIERRDRRAIKKVATGEGRDGSGLDSDIAVALKAGVGRRSGVAQ